MIRDDLILKSLLVFHPTSININCNQLNVARVCILYLSEGSLSARRACLTKVHLTEINEVKS